jgi:hypothetical protein
MKLREIAFSRCGDKMDISNICVFPYREDDWAWLRDVLTVDVVRQKFGALVEGPVHRYEFPNLHGCNFVLERALGGGGSNSLRPDDMGKSYQSLMLDIDIPDRGEKQ